MKVRICCLLISVVMVWVSRAHAQRVTDGLVALWDFDLGSGTVVPDVSGIGDPVDLRMIRGHLGDRVSWVPGALSVGEQTFVISSPGKAARISDALNATNDVTVEVWLRTAAEEQSPSWAQTAVIVDMTGCFRIDQFVSWYRGSTPYPSGRTSITAESPQRVANPDTVQHLVLTTSNAAGTHSLYLDNALVGVVSRRDWEFSCPVDGTLSVANISGLQRFWLGDLHMVAIYDRALDFFEIDQNFRAGPNPDLVLPDPLPPPLKAGDADQDLDFDQFDLIKVQQTAKYMTGEPATWGEGDWDGVVGAFSYPGKPPIGDGSFNQQDIIAAQQGGIYLTGTYGALAPSGERGDAQTSIVYDTNTGELAVDAPSGVELTSVNIDSAAGIFKGDAAQNLGGSFDNDADTNIFKATFGSSFGSLTFGNVAQTGLSAAFVHNDLTVVGSLAGGGDLGDVDLIYVPEPSTFFLLAAGLLFLAAFGRRRYVTA